jgi:NTE family protein
MGKRPKIGLALGAGGARGWCHIGVLRALQEADLEPDIVCGASMGALIGAGYCAGALDQLEEFALGMTAVKAAGLVDLDIVSGGLVSGAEVMGKLEELGISGNIEHFGKPFMAVATDIANGREIWMQEGDVLNAVRASIALPGLFSPVLHEGRWLLDGGMSNPIPVSCCRALGAEVIIAVNPNSRLHVRKAEEPEQTPGLEIDALIGYLPSIFQPAVKSYLDAKKDPKLNPPGYLDVIARAMDIMSDQIRRSRLAGDPPNIMVNVELAPMTILEFNRAAEAVKVGHAAMKAEMNDLKASL